MQFAESLQIVTRIPEEAEQEIWFRDLCLQLYFGIMEETGKNSA